MSWFLGVGALGVTALMLAVTHDSFSSPDVGSPGVAFFRQRTVSHINYVGMETWRSKILLSHKQQIVGIADIACIFVSTDVRECYGTYVLPLGKIQVQGEMTTPSSYQFAIVGGTGRYASSDGLAAISGDLVTFYIT